MKVFESGWQNAEGIKFFVRGWEPEKQIKAVVVLVHGLGEHTGRYLHVGEAFAQAGYVLAGFDVRGHGRSGGARGHTPRYESLLDDIDAFRAQMEARYPGKPVFIYGHSLGGNLVLNYVLRRDHKLRGVIATSPWLRVAAPIPAFKLAVARAAAHVLPSLAQASGLETAALSRDARVAEAYKHDPLTHDRISAALFLGTYEAGTWALEHAQEFPVSLLLMHGTGDRITSWRATQEFAQKAGKKATWKAWDDGYHELHNEPQGIQAVRFMIGWLDAQLKKK